MRTLREQAGISQRKMVALMKDRGHAWYQQTLSRVEKGEQGLKFSEATDVVEILDTTLDRLTWSPPEAQVTEFLYSAGTQVRQAHERVAGEVLAMLRARAHASAWAQRYESAPGERVQAARRDVLGRLAEWTVDDAVAEGCARFAAQRDGEGGDGQSPEGWAVSGPSENA